MVGYVAGTGWWRGEDGGVMAGYSEGTGWLRGNNLGNNDGAMMGYARENSS